MTDTIDILDSRKDQVFTKGSSAKFVCDKKSLTGSVSQRACAFCGSRVVLYPIADALHIVHGPIGCAVYNWDIRGAESSGPQLHRNSFSTDMKEMDIIYGGEKKLQKSLIELIDKYNPNAAFIYSTCIVGVIGDDVNRIAKQVEKEKGIPIIPVSSEGFRGTKKTGYQAACEAAYTLVGTADTSDIPKHSINILGDFNIAGETWIVRRYFEEIGVHIVATITGDGRVNDLRRCHGASLNLVQCSGSMTHLAKLLEKDHDIPMKRVSFFGIEDTAEALYETARHFNDPEMMAKAQALVAREIGGIMPEIKKMKKALAGRKAALYVGGAFKAFSLVRALGNLGVKTVLAGTQTGSAEDYEQLKEICDPGTIIVDDSNPLELAKYVQEKEVDIFIGGVKERPIAYKLGIGFCDHNHERKVPLAGFEGMVNFAREVYATATSPVWQFADYKHKTKTLTETKEDAS
ncbi:MULTISPECIES: nitrogenase iron-molybdenum cofactor biosynthesis protein NifE [unclassified Lentimonas]|uniref:nitrogenase iron-molybdenum cofactor biosynthesis protein NifE n=1 Tax=unclassified Lentimonas TaxID=2630993 RepID=UPI0013294A13|nr:MULTISPECIES: nitrogenase iron-molybdenum cofactor biosynthesis protein NifE [unclassified Lentimonas]CAA6677149.1 Nitrogenase FeMo-cofactor scaffold and assembly protein NifE [Lentimonas sp. CC4]CAA6686227.1 Nitrogenase FeMo-cofactor scaffold and assembly protein NifE [Lentimonas sp. CC6]CAA7074257.1 Nitrogenase FeMo-cofactor scaffold and assembly protein NifE [Lentimonas sp. CC4]CAA7171088.1 Nitrogenase FeMo-cofactor scaffold and assembly protein NifE [Lentimonas sp. CC21]CAA7180914.1 Nit